MGPGKQTRVLITGASGFIGSYLVHEALNQGYEVWAAIRRGSRRDKLTDPRIHLIELDYSSPQTIRDQVSGLAPKGEATWHYVIHNAGLTKTPKRELFYQVNAIQTKHLVEGLAMTEHCPDRFILMSSLGSYGPSHLTDKAISSEDPQQPNTDYGKSKQLAEQFLIASGLPFSIMHLTGVYGPGDRDYLMALQAIKKGWDFTAGLSKQHLTFVYASDVAEATFFVLNAPQAIGQRYMLTDGDVYTDAEFGRLAQRLIGRKRVLHMGIPLPIVYLTCLVGEIVGHISGRVTPLNLDKYRIFKQRSWICNDEPIRALGFRPKVKLEEGLRRTIAAAEREGLL